MQHHPWDQSCHHPLEPDRAGMAALGDLVLGRAMDLVEALPDRPAGGWRPR